MKKNKLIKYFYITGMIVFSLLFLLNNKSYALEDVDHYSELYKQYLELSDEEKEKVEVIPDKYGTTLKEYNEKEGLNNKNNSKLRLFKAPNVMNNLNTLPSRYSLADNYNIKVENQGQEGNCWTFASLETIETYLQMHGYGTFDFSENHLNYIESNLFSQTQETRKINTSGSYSNFQEYANKKFGPVSENDFPYFEDEATLKHKEYKQSELDSLLNVTPLAYVGEYVSFPSINKETTQYTDQELLEFREQVKKHIMENGAIFTIITAPSYFSGEYYNESTYGAYFNTTNDNRFWDHSHAVPIIGWDDNYSKDNFIETNRPEHNGAYIALNSWGNKFGDNGLYYISYDDAFVEQSLKGIKEAVLDPSQLQNITTFVVNDENLYKALKNKLGRSIVNCDDDTQQITMLKGNINEITYLDLPDYNISDLSGIENFENLYNINLSHNKISNIQPLLALHKLENIDLKHNLLTTIPTEFRDSEISSLSLAYNPITDFSGMADIKSIISLDLEGTSIKEEDLEYLRDLKITSLNLSKTSIKDYTVLKTLNDGLESDYLDLSLQQLNISYNEDIDYSTIPNVRYINVSNTDFEESDFSQIPDKSKLNSLDISYTNIHDLSFLSSLVITSINISGNRNIENLEVIKNSSYIDYEDAQISDVSIFKNFNCTQLNLNQNEIEDYRDLLENANLNYVELANNRISQVYNYSERPIVMLDENKIKPNAYNYDNVESIRRQKYVETLKVDTSRDNLFTDIASNLNDLYNSGISLNITNATMDYDNNEFKIIDYDKDVTIDIENGPFEGSTITYKIEKVDNTAISYLYINRSGLKTTYLEGEEFDFDSLKVYGVYDNESMSEIKDYTTTGANNLQIGSNLITIEKDGFSDVIEINVIPNNDILTLSFETEEIYRATLKKIGEIEEERKNYPEYYTRLQVLIEKDDETKTIKILKEDLPLISYLQIQSNEAISLEDTKQLTGLSGFTLDGKNFEDLSILNYFKEILDNKEDLFPYERYLALELKNNEKIEKLEDDIFRTLIIDNSKLTDINNLSHLSYIKYTGNSLPDMENILDSIRMITIDSTANIDELERDDNSNIVLPKLIKDLRDKGLEIHVNICDQIRDEQYLNPYNKNEIAITEEDGKLLINYDDIKDIDYEGSNQFIEISIKDVNYEYSNFDFKYNIKFKLFNHIEIEETEQPIEIEEDTIPDLSELTVYKVYSEKEKIETKDFTYSKEPINKETEEIEISYTEDGKTSKINIPIVVTDHVHEWGEWVVTKEPSETEEGKKERTCLKNENHKEIDKIDKLPEEEYRIIEGADQTIKHNTSIDLRIKINANHELFDTLSIDNNIVDPSNYAITRGSTVITIAADYLNTLDIGKHTIEAQYINNKSVSTSLTIVNEEEYNKDNTDTDDNDNENKSNYNNQKDSSNIDKTKTTDPKTGDDILNYVKVLVVSIIEIAIILIIRKK